jgi:hypothetical protein
MKTLITPIDFCYSKILIFLFIINFYIFLIPKPVLFYLDEERYIVKNQLQYSYEGVRPNN